MADGGLHEVHGRAAVERVADMGMAEPLRRHRVRQAGAFGRSLNDAVRLVRLERTTALARPEHEGIRESRCSSGLLRRFRSRVSTCSIASALRMRSAMVCRRRCKQCLRRPAAPSLQRHDGALVRPETESVVHVMAHLPVKRAGQEKAAVGAPQCAFLRLVPEIERHNQGACPELALVGQDAHGRACASWATT